MVWKVVSDGFVSRFEWFLVVFGMFLCLFVFVPPASRHGLVQGPL